MSHNLSLLQTVILFVVLALVAGLLLVLAFPAHG